jgi:hypothetical protein
MEIIELFSKNLVANDSSSLQPGLDTKYYVPYIPSQSACQLNDCNPSVKCYRKRINHAKTVM